MHEIVEAHDLTKDYGQNGIVTRALHGVNLSLTACEFFAMAGPSGSGKTTLLNIIGGLDGSFRTIGALTHNYENQALFERDSNDYLQSILRLTAGGHPTGRVSYQAHLVTAFTYNQRTHSGRWFRILNQGSEDQVSGC